jgi:NAD(P)H-hydrate epimerase
MQAAAFETSDGIAVPAVTAAEMAAVDRVAVEDIGLAMVQMMENAGRNLALEALEYDPASVTVLAGGGGNGGGGLACARHLHNHGVAVDVFQPPGAVDAAGAVGRQQSILRESGVSVKEVADPPGAFEADLLVEALIGYGVEGAIREPAASLIEGLNRSESPVIALDVPAGTDATTGESRGPAVSPERVLTLALPKTGLIPGEVPVTLADIAIPDRVYEAVGIGPQSPFGDSYRVPLSRSANEVRAEQGN